MTTALVARRAHCPRLDFTRDTTIPRRAFRSLTFSLLTNTLPGPRASEVTTIWRHTNLFIIIIIIITQSLVDPFQHGKKGGPYSITERGVPELIPVLGSQPAGDVSHKPGGGLPLLSAGPAVTPATLKRAATSFAAW